MATWVAAIIEVGARTDFWEVAKRHDVAPMIKDAPAHILIDCFAGLDFEASFKLAQGLSQELSTVGIGFAIQTGADVHEMRVFERGALVRHLQYARDEGGWLKVEGARQPWERVYFFDDGSTAQDGGPWPDMLTDELSDDDIRRYEQARREGDPTTVLSLLHPSSTAAMGRVCELFGLSPDKPGARLVKQSWWSRVFGKRGE